jgi:carbon storage regulator
MELLGKYGCPNCEGGYGTESPHTEGTKMLAIKRKAGESFTIGDNVRVTVVRIEGNKVSIGVAAPREVAVVRDDAKRAERKLA